MFCYMDISNVFCWKIRFDFLKRNTIWYSSEEEIIFFQYRSFGNPYKKAFWIPFMEGWSNYNHLYMKNIIYLVFEYLNGLWQKLCIHVYFFVKVTAYIRIFMILAIFFKNLQISPKWLGRTWLLFLVVSTENTQFLQFADIFQ